MVQPFVKQMTCMALVNPTQHSKTDLCSASSIKRALQSVWASNEHSGGNRTGVGRAGVLSVVGGFRERAFIPLGSDSERLVV